MLRDIVVNDPDTSTVGTSFHGKTVRATFGELVALFGAPVKISGDKTRFEWTIQDPHHRVFCIYDNYSPLSRGDLQDSAIPSEWRLASHDPALEDFVVHEIHQAIRKLHAPEIRVPTYL